MGSEASEDEETELETQISVSADAATAADASAPEATARATQPVAVSPKRNSEPRDSDSNNSFPTPFKCSGEFCGFRLEDAFSAATRSAVQSGSDLVAKYANLAASTERLSPKQLLFSQDEQQALDADQWRALLGSMRLLYRPDAPVSDLRVITYKSIALAKANKAHLTAATRSAQGKKAASKKHKESIKGANKDKEHRRSSLLNSTASQELREGSRVRVYGELDGIANYYRQVRVCGDCYAIYMLLDRVRQMMHERGSQPSYKSRRYQSMAALHGEWNIMVDKEVQEKEKIFLRQQSKPQIGESVAALDSNASLPELFSTSDDSTEFSLPPLVSPTSNGSRDSRLSTDILSGRGESSGASLSSVTMPPLSVTGSDPKPFTTLVASASEPVRVQQMLRSNDSVSTLEKYLRGQSKQIEEQKLQEGQLFRSKTPRKAETATGRKTTKPFANVLLIDSDTKNLDLLQQTLHTIPSLELTIESICDGSEALSVAKDYSYDLILCERDLTGVINGLEFTKLLRHHQAQRKAAASSSVTKSLIICMSTKTSREDLQLYKDSGMDGCVGKPINPDTLRRTVQAALAKLASAVSKEAAAEHQSSVDAATEALAKAKINQQERRKRRKRRLEAASALPFPGIADMNVDEDYMHGVFQMDGETSMPFCVMGESNTTPTATPNTFFNLVVIHDLFDTWERMQILLRPIITRYQGHIQVLVWNYPGQAYTTWRPGVVLNNSYHAQCFQALLKYTRSQGLFREAPYYLVGIGNGGNIATAFCCHAPPLDAHTRGLLLVNSFTFISAQLAQFFHDCLKVFACTPESRPDLPVYFHTRFLFSSAYLARVSTPLALNLYTAVTNLITLNGRKALCHGALAHHDLRSELGRLKIPCFSVCSAQNSLVDAGNQVQSVIDGCSMELVDSIGKVLRHNPRFKRKVSCVLWLASGHEVFQECKQDMLLLVEQLVTGFHEIHDLPHGKSMAALALTSSEKPKKPQPVVNPIATRTNARDEDEAARLKLTAIGGSFEDSFMDRVLSSVAKVIPSSRLGTANHPSSRGTNQLVSLEKTKWQQFQHETSQHTKSVKPANASVLGKMQKQSSKESTATNQTSPSKLIAMTSWDPATPAFERLSSNVIYKIGNGSKIYPENSLKDLPEVKEYMGWRVRRNQKRLQRMERQARVIQRAFRAFSARMMTIRMKRERCAIHLQRLWRAKLARKKYHGMKKEDWAIRLLQRHWRGKLGRDSFQERMRKYLAAVEMQRIVRGGLARRHVHRVRVRIHNAAVEIQRLMRRFIAVRRMFKQRLRRNAAITLQRVFRGCLGRRRFTSERDKFLFSRTQSQGIAFGKQMLLEYKLYGTKLQSEVALLAKAKTEIEVDAEALVKEICEFEEGIQLLEREMHALSQIETESMTISVDEQGKWQLREQKMRLDREFTQMLAQIAVRKEKLSVLEEKLQQLDKERLNKEEELKGLERKLVVLLDEQQQELNKIKQKQLTQSQLMLDLMPSGQSGASTLPPGSGSPGFASPWTGSAPTPSHGGASTQIASATAFTPQQREEANALMESTETMMKFGFMSMSMTYFSSMNMVRAMRKIGAHHMTLDSAAVVSNLRWPENSAAASGGTPGIGLTSGTPGVSSPVGFMPSIPKGSFGGQQPMQVAGWSVADVGRWLDTLALGQYKRAFSDAAVDGALLLHLNDEDLKNTLGMEHKLHRKKIVTSVEQLRESERVQMKRLYGSNGPDALPSGVSGVSSIPLRSPSPERSAPLSGVSMSSTVANPISLSAASADTEPTNISSVAGANLPVMVPFADFCLLVRHGKLKQLKEALANVPDRRFDPLTVMQPFSSGVGTVYDDLLEKSAFHINKGDDKGNSPLLLAAQNNQLKVAQLLITKGANPNHQNAHGHTAGHYAMAYSFFDLGAWLLDPDKGGGRDDVVNENGLTAYDGLA